MIPKKNGKFEKKTNGPMKQNEHLRKNLRNSWKNGRRRRRKKSLRKYDMCLLDEEFWKGERYASLFTISSMLVPFLSLEMALFLTNGFIEQKTCN
mmetsp:Transcript_28619/g.41623  ORF Transcript_28619/g.41623 Transcript_28619/m.41623 type:complete len:95 (+) Transcript_28619:650-934(+)